MNLTKEQYDIVTSIAAINEPRKIILIDSIPGSGKTLTLCCSIAYLVEYHNVNKDSIMLLTYTRNAKEYMRSKLKTMMTNDIPYIGTVHAIAFKFIYDKELNASNNFYCPDELLSLFKSLLTDILAKKKYNLIIQNIKYLFIDEFQDIDKKQYDIINLIQQISYCMVIYFGDKDQSIYQFNKNIVNIDGQKGIIKYKLTENFRNSPEVVAFANKYLSIKEANDKFIITKKVTASSDTIQKITINGFNTLYDELKHIIKYVNTISNKNNKKILIVSRFRLALNVFENLLIKYNVPYYLLDESKYIMKGKLVLSTIHGVKGLEADIVILINAGNVEFCDREDDEYTYSSDEERNLMYVAITRGKEQLYITYHYQVNYLLDVIIDDNVIYTKPTEMIKPTILPKNRYIGRSVTEIIKRLTEEDYKNIKQRYKITCQKVKVHNSLQEHLSSNSNTGCLRASVATDALQEHLSSNSNTGCIQGSVSSPSCNLKVMTELSSITSNLPMLLGNYIDHYIGWLVTNSPAYHPDLSIIKIVEYINYNYNIYRVLYGYDANTLLDIIRQIANNGPAAPAEALVTNIMQQINIDEKEALSVYNHLNRMVNDEKILSENNILTFLQRPFTRMIVPEHVKRYLTFNNKLLASTTDRSIRHKIIFDNSLITAFIGGNSNSIQIMNYIKKGMFTDDNEYEWFEDINKYIKDQKYDVYQKSLHGLNMNGIIDLYSTQNETLADIKCSLSNYVPGSYIIQLLYYYNLMLELKIPVKNKVKLYFPLTGYEMIYTIVPIDN
jgi:hypothetical protein